jgi:hypothetical protein
MSQMDDITTYALVTATFFFVALAFVLLVRYRRLSQKINASTDLGHDLWSSLEQRLRKQDERILDMMGRLEVVQSRVMNAAPAQAPIALHPSLPTAPPQAKVEVRPVGVTEQKPVVQQPASQESQASQAPAELPKAEPQLDETQLSAMKLLSENPKSTRQLTDALKKSREHTARIMKGLYELGLVSRNDSSKPFVYQLTEEGRRHVAS